MYMVDGFSHWRILDVEKPYCTKPVRFSYPLY